MSRGIDIPIDELVTSLTAQLWTDKTVQYNGRIFRNEHEGKIIPQKWITPHDYVDVLTNDAYHASCFFDVQPTSQVIGDVFEADVWACWMLDLLALYPTLTRTEATEQAHIDILTYLDHPSFTIKKIVRGWEAFNGYEYPESGIRGDMSPYYLLRYEMKIFYTNC